MQVFIYCKITLYVSGVYRTHRQEYNILCKYCSIAVYVVEFPCFLLAQGMITLKNIPILPHLSQCH